MDNAATQPKEGIPFYEEFREVASDAYLNALEKIRKDLEPEMAIFDAKVAAHRATPEYKAYRAAKDAEKAAALKGRI